MTIHLILQAALRQRHPGLADPLRTAAATVGQLLDEQHIPRSEAAILFVNQRRATLEAALQEGDEIRVFPLLGGG